MNKAMRERTFHDKIKGCVDIDHTKIEQYFTELLKKQGLDVKILRAWIHFMMPGSDHEAGHKHEDDIGVYYLQAPKNSGNLRFDDLNSEIEPEEDQFIIVPALTTHSMLENKSTGIRVAMGFPFEVLN